MSYLTGKELKEAFHKALGYYPVILVDEYFSHDYPDGYNYHDYSYIHIDAEKLDLDEYDNLRYVSSILESALMLAERGKESGDTSASRKYSFGDTPSWWDLFETKELDGRKIIHLEIGVHS